MSTNPRDEHRLQVVLVQVFSALAGLTGMQALAGWYAGIPLMTSFAQDWIPMAPSTALLFVLLGLAAFLRAAMPLHPNTRRIGLVLGALCTLAAGLLLVLSLTGVRWQAEYLGASISGAVGGAQVGHMSPLTAATFLIASLSLLATQAASPSHARRAEVGLWPAILVVLISFVLTFAYFAGTPLLYGSRFIPPALPTSLAFLSLGAALIALAGIWTSPSQAIREASRGRAGTTLLVTYLVLAVGIVTAASLYARNHQEQFRSQVEQELTAIVGLKVQEIARWRAERLRDGDQFHRNQAFTELVMRALDPPGDPQARLDLLRWMARMLVIPEYERVELLDAHGTARFWLPENAEPGQARHPDELEEVLRSQQVTFFDLHRDGPEDPIHMELLIPIRAQGDGGGLIGVLTLRIDPSRDLFPLTGRWPTPNQTAETVLLRRDGQDALVLNALRLDRQAALTRRIPLERTDIPSVQGVLGYTGIVEGVEYDGSRVLAEVRRVPNSPWFIEARIGVNEVLAPLQARLRNLTALVIALLLGAGAGTGWIWRQQQLRFYQERVELERAGEAQYRSALDAMLEGAQIIGFDWRYLYLNDTAARYGQIAKERLLGRTVLEMYPGIESTQMFADMNRCMQERAAHLAEYPFTLPDGRHAWFEFLIQPVPEGIFILSLDITERRQREQSVQQLNLELENRVAERTAQLETANQELEAFSYSVSHDLRAPLRAVDGFSRILLEEHAADLDAEGSRLLQIIRGSTRQMDQLISDLLDLSRVSRSEMHRGRVDMAQQARSIFADVATPEVRETFAFSVGDLPEAEADPALLRQVWSNLLSNAVKYSLPARTRSIEVGGQREADTNVYFVRDRGVGFDPDYGHKLFGVFQRLHSAQEFEGTGVGLAIVRRIIRRHGGEVWAEGKAGEGAAFYFSLPTAGGQQDG